jgi:hypothetical protein
MELHSLEISPCLYRLSAILLASPMFSMAILRSC